MTRREGRRRAIVMLALAMACGGLAASAVRGRERELDARVGSPVPALVAARDLPAEHRLKASDLAVRQVPERYLPRDTLAAARDAVGLRTAAPMAAGGYLTAGSLGAGRRSGATALRAGERAVEVAVTGGSALAGAGPGARVDVLVSTDARGASGHTYVALEDVELLALRSGAPAGQPSEGGAAAAADSVATLRVTLPQAVELAAAHNYAREVRLLARPPGEGRSR